jgi:hypothetical protein
MIQFSRNSKKILENEAVSNEKKLNDFSILLIKIVGVFAILLGMAILVGFWYWVIKMLYKIS